jgi:hypothetical protein
MSANDAADLIAEMKEEKAEAQVQETFRNRAAAWVAVLAAMMAIQGLGGDNATDSMVSNNVQASDAWSFYQGKTVRQTVYKVAADQIESDLETAGPAQRPALEKRLAKYRETVARYDDEPDAKAPNDPTAGEGKKQISARAKAFEAARDVSVAEDGSFDYAEMLFQLALVLASVSILTASRKFLVASMSLGGLGAILTLNGFFLLFTLPF